jgi:D-alanyl-D-alanine carboxypeptidase
MGMPAIEPLLAILSNGQHSAAPPSRPVPWWSFTKTVLAAAALRLVDRGKLALDKPLPEQSYTLRQLLQHTSGVRNYTQLASYADAVRTGQSPWPPEEMLKRVAGELPAFPPNTTWAYSNTGYYIVRTIMQDVTGDPLEQVLDRLVFSPLGVSGVIVGKTPADLAVSQWGNTTGYDPQWVYHGLLIGSATAAARTLDGILHGNILPDWLLAAMCKPMPLGKEIPGRPGRNFGYGLGLMIALDGPAGPSYGHTGHDWTSVAAVYHFSGLQPPRTIAAFLPGDHEAKVEWAAVTAALESQP